MQLVDALPRIHSLEYDTLDPVFFVVSSTAGQCAIDPPRDGLGDVPIIHSCHNVMRTDDSLFKTRAQSTHDVESFHWTLPPKRLKAVSNWCSERKQPFVSRYDDAAAGSFGTGRVLIVESKQTLWSGDHGVVTRAVSRSSK
jgi:hypothetical protein